MSKLLEVADDVQKWFNVAIKADAVLANNSASAENKRTAMKHKILLLGICKDLQVAKKVNVTRLEWKRRCKHNKPNGTGPQVMM